MKGNLEETPIEQVLASIEKNKRTGILSITLKSSTVTITFRKGQITNVDSAGVKRFLGAMLVRANILTRRQLSEVLTVQQKRFLPLGELLIERGWLRRDELVKMLEFQAYDLLYSLFFVNSGWYIFFKNKTHVAYSDNLVFVIDVVALIKKGLELRSASAEVNQVVTSERFVWELVPRLANSPEKENTSYSEDEKIILKHLDGNRSISNISVSTFLGIYRTKKAIWCLFQRGMVKKSKVLLYFDRERKIYSEDESQIHIRLETAPTILLNVFIVAILIILMVLSKLDPIHVLKKMVNQPYVYGKVTEYLADFQKEKIRNYLMVYYLDKGHFPESLDQLVELKHGFLKIADMDYPWDKPYFYQRKDAGYLLLSPNE